ncbi:REST corepressor 3 isoform X2 [Bradysia coprophila]|uniref:REST corepressor 3 isoform X2 n=1 Tax=Bradysia coprophila TaxID=38358 RepID=UPI00187DAAA5|nr:REST corepressor 3 isoform X2 [Bradysia coprophila]
MVLNERNNENNVRNGKRSRGPSPNGHGGSPDSSSDDDSTKKIGKTKTKSEYEEKIRVGKDYQVVCPELIPITDRKPETLTDRALLVWSPTTDIPESKLEEYISVAKEKYGYNGEQALGMLFWHKHDLERAVLDLANFTPFPDEWTVEDKVLFEQAFQFHGKSFHRIRQMLPDKPIPSLVKYYYSWKKTRSRTSVMDRQEKIKAKEGSENGSENGSNEESDTEEKTSATTATNGTSTKDDINMTKSEKYCSRCGVACNYTNLSVHGELCNSCFHHWRRTGAQRPITGPTFAKRGRGVERHKRKPPRGMHINHDDIVALASSDQSDQGSVNLLASMDRELNTLLSQIQMKKQLASALKANTEEDNKELIPPETMNRLSSRWNNEEFNLAIVGIRKYGKQYGAIADIIGSKTEAQVRTFFVNYRKKHNLDGLVKEYEAQLKLNEQKDLDASDIKQHEPEIMEIDADEENTNTKDDDDVEEVSQPILKALNDN